MEREQRTNSVSSASVAGGSILVLQRGVPTRSVGEPDLWHLNKATANESKLFSTGYREIQFSSSYFGIFDENYESKLRSEMHR